MNKKNLKYFFFTYQLGKPIYCVNGETSAIEDRQSNFCSSSLPCSQYCTFASGVCTKIESDEQFVCK